MAEMTLATAAAALREGRVRYTPCPRPAGPLIGMRKDAATKIDGWVTDLFHDHAGRFYMRAIKGARVEWLHVTVVESTGGKE